MEDNVKAEAQVTGFNLIELMVIIAIIAILASIAIPSYQGYTVRAKISEIIALANKDNLSITEFYMVQGKMPNSAAQAGMNLSTNQSNYVSTIEYEIVTDNQANIAYTLDNLSKDADGTRLVFVGVGSEDGIRWDCATALTNTPNRYLPPLCRG